MHLSHYQIQLSQIAKTAKIVATQIAGFIHAQKINPANTVVMVGEFHTQLAHQYFEKKLLQNLHRELTVQTLFVEGIVSLQKEVDQCAARNTYQTMVHGVTQKNSMHKMVSNIPMQYAFGQKIDTRLIDPKDEYDDEEEDYFIGDVLSEDLYDKYRKNKAVSKMLRKHKPDLFQKNLFHHISSATGILKRDLFMMDNIVNMTADKKGLSMAIVGEYHVTNVRHPLQPSLAEMLHANGKDIVAVTLRPAQDLMDGNKRIFAQKSHAKKVVSTYNKQDFRVAENRKSAFALIDVDIAGQVQQSWTGLAGLCLRNMCAPDLYVPAFAMAEKLEPVLVRKKLLP